MTDSPCPGCRRLLPLRIICGEAYHIMPTTQHWANTSGRVCDLLSTCRELMPERGPTIYACWIDREDGKRLAKEG